MGALTYNRATTLSQQLRNPFLLFFVMASFFSANHSGPSAPHTIATSFSNAAKPSSFVAAESGSQFP
jgi:hypothetical protein